MIRDVINRLDFRNLLLDHHLHPLLQGHVDHSTSLASATEFKVGTVFLDLKKPDHSSVSSYHGIHLVLQNLLDLFIDTAAEFGNRKLGIASLKFVFLIDYQLSSFDECQGIFGYSELEFS